MEDIMIEDLKAKRRELLKELDIVETTLKDKIIKKLSYQVGDLMEQPNGTRGVITRIRIKLYSDNYTTTVHWKKLKVNGDLYAYESEVYLNKDVKNLGKYK